MQILKEAVYTKEIFNTHELKNNYPSHDKKNMWKQKKRHITVKQRSMNIKTYLNIPN